jgi:hypothetical protein
MPAFAGKGEQKLQAAGRTPNAGETLAEIPAVEELAEDIVNDGTPEAVLSLISVIVDPFELLEIVLDAGVEIALQIRDQENRIQRHATLSLP